MRISRDSLLTTSVLAAAALAGAAAVIAFGPAILHPNRDQKPALAAAREPVPAPPPPRTVPLSEIVGEPAPPPAKPEAEAALQAAPPDPEPSTPVASPAPAEAAISSAPAEAAVEVTPAAAEVTAAIDQRPPQAPAGKRGFVILQIGDSHTAADVLTGELRRRLQVRYGRGAPGYVTAGRPHAGVRSASLDITVSSGWSYKSLQQAGAEPAEFWLSGYNAVASAPGETMTFSSAEAQTFDMIEIEVVRQPEGGAIDVRLDGALQSSHSLKSPKTQPVVIRLMPAQGATGNVRQIAITTSGPGQVVIASVAIYNRQGGLTYNSVGYVGGQASLVNKLSDKLFADDLTRIKPDIVVLAFGTSEAASERLDLAEYGKSYARVIARIKAALPGAAIVVMLPPDFAERTKASGNSDCSWRTPTRLKEVREVQRKIAQREGLTSWNWASIMPSECGAHRWVTASPPLMTKDHIHFTAEGYKKSAEQFLAALIPVIEKVRGRETAARNN